MMTTVKLFMNGRSQAVRLRREFRFSGNQVRVRRFGLGVLLEPAKIEPDTWFEALDCFEKRFMPEARATPGPTRPLDTLMAGQALRRGMTLNDRLRRGARSCGGAPLGKLDGRMMS